jgi:hypothetical protein
MKNVSSASSLPAYDYIQLDSFILDFTTSSTNVTPGGSVCTDMDAAFAAGVSGFVNMECLGGGPPDCDISASGSPPAAAAFDSDSGSPIVVHIAPDNAQSDQNITDHFTGDGGFVSNADVISVIDTAILVTAATGPDSGLTGDDNFAIALDSPVDSFAPAATDDSSVASIDANDYDVFLLSGLADSTADLEWSPVDADVYPSGTGSIVSGNSFVAFDGGALSAESALAAPPAALSSEFTSNPNLTDIFGSGEVHDLAPPGAVGEGSASQSSPSVLSYGDLGQSPASLVPAASPVATGEASSGLVINVTYDSSVADAPAGFEAVVASVVQFYESEFTDPVTLNIDVGWGEIAGGSLLAGAAGESQSYLEGFSYSEIRSALVANATSSAQLSAVNALPASAAANGTYYLTLADATALGLASSGNLDGYVGFDSSLPFAYNDSSGVPAGEYDLYGVVAHEIAEVMGRVSLLDMNAYSALDLFRYSGAGGTAYASANGGSTVLNYFNTNPDADLGDWASSAGNDSYDAVSNSGVVNAVTQADLTVMNIIGYDVGTPTPGTPPTISGTQANQTVNDNASLKPFAGVAVADSNANQTETVAITFAGANGALSDANAASDHSTIGSGSYTVAGTAGQVTADLDNLVFTPTARQVAPSNTVTTDFTIAVTDTAGETASDSTTSVVATAIAVLPTISGTHANQSVNDNATIKAFSAVTIADANFGQTETVTITFTGTNGALSDPNAASDHSTTGSGSYKVIGTAAQVTADLDNLVFTPTTVAPGNTVTTGFTIGVADTAGQTASNSTTSVVATAVAPPAAAPTVTAQTPNQTWAQGHAVDLTLAANTFTDPQGEAMIYAGTLWNGTTSTPLPSWLHFNSTTDTFTGTVPNTATGLTIEVTATDTSGLSASETFAVLTPASSPTVTDPTATQTWELAQSVNFTLAADTFTDPQGEAMTYAATLWNGITSVPLPSWLHFNGTTDTFTGTVPNTATGLNIEVTATDTSGLSASETFAVLTPASSPTVTAHTPNQTWVQGHAVDLTLAVNTFTDPQQEALTYSATLSNGAALPSWLQFNAATGTFSGSVPSGATGLNIEATATDSSGLSASETFSVATPAAPTVTAQTPTQTWAQGEIVEFMLAANTFTDPQGEAMTYAATLSNGAALPSWLHFYGPTDSFIGAVPSGATGLNIEVTATDTGGASASETFAVLTPAAALIPLPPLQGLTSIEQQAEAMYVAYFGRAGDPVGTYYWMGDLDTGQIIDNVAMDFANQVESQNLYTFLASLTNASDTARVQFIDAIYQNLFNRAPDTAGLNYWDNELQQDQQTLTGNALFQAVGGFILEVIRGAQDSAAGQDITSIQNKVTVATYFTEQLLANNITYHSNLPANIDAQAHSVVGNTNSTAASVTTEEAAVNADISIDLTNQNTSSVSVVGSTAGHAIYI